MTYSPALMGTGYLGWVSLKRTQTLQTTAMTKTAEYKRDEDYFRANIGKIKTADALVADRRLLKVALTAYGLEGDINAKAFIKKVLSDGTLKTDALANRLSDKAYATLSADFGFGDFTTPRTQLSTFADEILTKFKARSFESAVGDGNNDYRLALNAERELADLAGKTNSEDTKWFTIMGSTPLRKVMETALGLPTSTGSLDLDLQLKAFKDRSEQVFGSSDPAQFTDSAKMSKLVKTYLLRSELATFNAQSASSNAVMMMLSQSVSLARNRTF